MRKNNVLSYIIGDHLGSTSLVTDASGAVINQTKYKAWGETRYSSGTEQTKYGYTGQYSYASDFGLHFYNARWYDSSLSRFAQADTIVPNTGSPKEWDRYSYTTNNPLRYTDPTGHRNCEEDGYNCPGNEIPRRFNVACGSQGAIAGPAPRGPLCGAGSQSTHGMTIWHRGTLRNYVVNHFQYPGYEEYDKPGVTPLINDPAKNPKIGKSGQALAMDLKTGNINNTIAAGYSSGVETVLFYAELRQARGLNTDLILLGPSVPMQGYDPNGAEINLHTFSERIVNLSYSGNHILVMDDVGYQELKDKFVNPDGTPKYENISYYSYTSGSGHLGSQHTPIYLETAIYWLDNNYTLPPP